MEGNGSTSDRLNGIKGRLLGKIRPKDDGLTPAERAVKEIRKKIIDDPKRGYDINEQDTFGQLIRQHEGSSLGQALAELNSVSRFDTPESKEEANKQIARINAGEDPYEVLDIAKSDRVKPIIAAEGSPNYPSRIGDTQVMRTVDFAPTNTPTPSSNISYPSPTATVEPTPTERSESIGRSVSFAPEAPQPLTDDQQVALKMLEGMLASSDTAQQDYATRVISSNDELPSPVLNHLRGMLDTLPEDKRRELQERAQEMNSRLLRERLDDFNISRRRTDAPDMVEPTSGPFTTEVVEVPDSSDRLLNRFIASLRNKTTKAADVVDAKILSRLQKFDDQIAAPTQERLGAISKDQLSNLWDKRDFIAAAALGGAVHLTNIGEGLIGVDGAMMLLFGSGMLARSKDMILNAYYYGENVVYDHSSLEMRARIRKGWDKQSDMSRALEAKLDKHPKAVERLKKLSHALATTGMRVSTGYMIGSAMGEGFEHFANRDYPGAPHPASSPTAEPISTIEPPTPAATNVPPATPVSTSTPPDLGSAALDLAPKTMTIDSGGNGSMWQAATDYVHQSLGPDAQVSEKGQGVLIDAIKDILLRNSGNNPSVSPGQAMPITRDVLVEAAQRVQNTLAQPHNGISVTDSQGLQKIISSLVR